MKFDVVTIFPEFFAGPFHYGIIRRAREASIIDIHVHDLRQFTRDRHKTVDDRPFGGGEGMVLKPEPMFEAVETILSDDPGARQKMAIVLLSASGRIFGQEMAERFAQLEHMILLCGRYEGVDERVAEHLATDEVSVGDFVLSGGEIGAALIVDAVTRLLPGALGNEDSPIHESFSSARATEQNGGRAGEQAKFLDWPHYTRPAEFRGWTVPDVLLSGNHEEIRRWRERVAMEKTRRNRPDLLESN